MNKPQVRIVAEYLCRLLQFREIDVHPGYLRSRDLRQMMRQPAIPTAHLQDVQVPFAPAQVADQPERGTPPEFPFPAVRMLTRDLRQSDQLLIRTKPVLQAADNDIFFFEEYCPKPGMALHLNIGQYGGIG